jgi:polysaccharide biosynthesis transport protein
MSIVDARSGSVPSGNAPSTNSMNSESSHNSAFSSSGDKDSGNENRLDLVSLIRSGLRLLKKHLLWLILILIGALAIGVAVTILTPPVYMASGSVQIDPDQSTVATVKDIVQEQRQSDNIAFMQTQYGKLRSRSLAERVATKIGPERVLRELGLIDPDAASTQAGAANKANQPATQAASQVQLEKATLALVGMIRIRPVVGSRLVTISLQSANKEFAALIVNTYIDEFISNNLQRRFEASSYARTFLESRIEALRLKLETSERDLVEYATGARIVNQPEGADGKAIESPQQAALRSLTAAKAEATRRRIEAEEGLRAMQGSAGAGQSSQASSAREAIRIEQAKARAEYSDKLQVLGPNYPTVRQLAARVAEYDRQLSQEASRVRGADLAEATRVATAAIAVERRLAVEVETLQVNALETDRRAIGYNILKRELDTNKALYDALLQRYREIGVAGGIGVNNISIVDRANIPKIPVAPRPAVNAAISLILGGLLACAFIFLLENWGQSFRRPEQVGESLSLPMLGAIPKYPPNTDLLTELALPRAPTTEAFHALRASIQFAQASGLPKSIFFTSAVPSEGKTSISIALSVVLARTGLRVCLVDADLRKPNVHRMLGLRSKVGLSSILLGESNIENALQVTIEPNLSVVTAGPELSNPSEFLSGPGCRKIITDFENSFDVVLFDGPPLLGLADAPILATQIESVVFVVGANGTSKAVAQRALNRLRNSRTNLLGAVLTKFDYISENFGGYGYDKAYSYQAYAYGAKDTNKATAT